MDMKRNRLIFVFAALVAILPVAAAAVNLYTDWLWFQEIGYSGVFATIFNARLTLGFGVAGVMFVFLAANVFAADALSRVGYIRTGEDAIELPGREMLAPRIRRILLLVSVLAAMVVGIEASARWRDALVFLNATPFGDPLDPVFGKDISFYVFRLPFLKYAYQLCMTTVALGAVAAIVVYAYKRGFVLSERGIYFRPTFTGHVSVLLALYIALRAVGYHLSRYAMLTTSRGFVNGIGYTDLHVRLPMIGILIVLCIVAAVFMLINVYFRNWKIPLAGIVLIVLGSMAGWAWPEVIQRFKVTPNEKNYEIEYIKHQIKFTRQAYGLVPGENVTLRMFEARKNLDPRDINRNQSTIKNIRLWDPRPLLSTYQQLQGIRPYYRFGDVDVDRYMLNGEYTQVTIAARELDYAKLPDKRWINEHFSFTHGYGLVVSPVTDIAEEGRPNMIVRDIPPEFDTDLKVTQPRIYFGELSNDYVFVNSTAGEIDYPEGGGNKYSDYTGKGGISVGNLGRRLMFALRFGAKDIIFNRNITADTRILINRNIVGDKSRGGRARTAMPVLIYDDDPYVVVDADGRLKWIMDAYTVTDSFPYSERVSGSGQGYNYIRNPVKVVADAFDGKMDFYVTDPQDPIIRTYMKIFPGVFKSMKQMPADLKTHIRYPEDLFRIQAEIFSVYQMEDPRLFYEKEDRWMLPTEQFHDEEQPMDPYYTIMRLPGEKDASEEYVLMLPFTPKGRENMSAWMCARNDYDKGVYGKLLVYKFPAQQKNIYGPMQIEARIMQQGDIAEQIGLWKRETNVIRGNLMVIPIADSLMYVEPIYLKAKTSEIPELKRVIVAIGDDIAMDETLVGAIRKVLGDRPVLGEMYKKELRMLANAQDKITPAKLLPGQKDTSGQRSAADIATRAYQNFKQAEQHFREWNFEAFEKNWDTVEKDLDELRNILSNQEDMGDDETENIDVQSEPEEPAEQAPVDEN